MILKSDIKGAQERVKLMNLLKSYERMLSEVVQLTEGEQN
jgi:hypothetical protein